MRRVLFGLVAGAAVWLWWAVSRGSLDEADEAVVIDAVRRARLASGL